MPQKWKSILKLTFSVHLKVDPKVRLFRPIPNVETIILFRQPTVQTPDVEV
jgi:hypothetical protein